MEWIDYKLIERATKRQEKLNIIELKSSPTFTSIARAISEFIEEFDENGNRLIADGWRDRRKTIKIMNDLKPYCNFIKTI